VYVYDQAFERLDSFEAAERAARGGRLGVKRPSPARW